MIKDYIFTITNGRSGQATLHKYLKLYSIQCLSAFEEPNINFILPKPFNNIEKKFRRKYIETDELLGRGKIITAYQNKNFKYIERIASIRLRKISKYAKKENDKIYFDISKFYVRGLYEGFNSLLNSFKLVFLVRDPLLNMKSYINRNKNFLLDNSSPCSRSNIFILNENITKEELYLWSWCETFLRYNIISKSKKVSKSVVINTDDLDKPNLVKRAFDKLEIKYKPFKKLKKVNTNEQVGNLKTHIDRKDIKILKAFIRKVPKDYKSLTKALNNSLNLHEKKI